MAVRVVVVKKKPVDAHRVPSDGLTGMSSDTKKHFLEVKKKMDDYLARHQDLGADQMPLHQDKSQTNLPPRDGHKAIHSSKSSSSTHPTKSSHHPSKSMPTDSRHKKSISKYHIDK